MSRIFRNDTRAPRSVSSFLPFLSFPWTSDSFDARRRHRRPFRFNPFSGGTRSKITKGISSSFFTPLYFEKEHRLNFFPHRRSI